MECSRCFANVETSTCQRDMNKWNDQDMPSKNAVKNGTLELTKTLKCRILTTKQDKKMPRVKRNTDATLRLQCDDPEDKFTVSYTNMGEPFRDGISIGIENEEFNKHLTVMLCNSEAIQLRNLLLEHYPLDK